ncbi:MAG: lytic transglycosylase domain-containing protein [Clostridia bacterium]|nr:lytic transglycosylase domain-containing protein [Clostridia bacterium]
MIKSKKLIVASIIILILFLLFGVFHVHEKILKMIYPKEYSEFVEKYSTEYNVNSNLVYAVIKAESNFDINAKSNKGARGLMQLMEETAKDINKKLENTINEREISSKLNEPEYNINLGTKYLSILIEKYGNIEIALTAYNAGIGTVDNWLENGTLSSDGSNIEKIPYKETNNYVRKILRDYKLYNQLYNE